MKKRFTLMMMVLCILMSIPLKMMADIVTIHYIGDENWDDYAAYVYDITGSNGSNLVTDAWPGQAAKATDIKVVDGNKKEVTWEINLKSCELKNARVIFNNNKKNDALQHPTGEGWHVVDGASYNKDGKITSSGGGDGSTPEEWNTVETNRLTDKKRVYTHGFYLAGDFFTFDKNEGKYKINYDDAVFKFQQQTDQDISIAKGARTVYEVYKVDIPASLTAHAQVMYVDEFGITKNIFGPGTTKGISRTCPNTDKSTDWEEAKVNVCNPITQENSNYWNFASRNETKDEYSDGMYNLYIAVEPTTHTVKKWKITHISDKRVAYIISDAPDAIAIPLYDTYKPETREKNPQFFNNFYGTVNFAANRSYYVISNYIINNDKVDDAKDYGTIKDFYLNRIPSPTTNKLFLQGNGGLDFTGNNPDNIVFPNGAPLKVNNKYWGTQIVEYNPSRADANKSVFGLCGDLILKNQRVVLNSVSLVGDAIPGTTNADGSWNYKSKIADMIFDETERCYKATVVTTADDGQSKFRFVGNRDSKITWYENTDGSVPEDMAKHPHDSDDPKVLGHTADANDPNKVNYTQDGANPEEDYHIIWNRPAGRWTVRLYFYTYSDGVKPVTEDYYTITASNDMVLHDVTDIVYGSEDNKQNIYNKGEYKFLRTWSAKKTWKISNKVDVFVVNKVVEDESAVKLTLKNINKLDDTGKYHVIPANTGVILATKSDASEIAGARFVARQNYKSYNELVIPMEENGTVYEYEGKDNRLLPLYYSKVVPASDDKNFNYFFAYYNARIATKDEKTYGASDYLLGFWISKGSKPYQSNSSYLQIPKEEAATLNRLGTSYDDFYTGGLAKKVPGVIFDFDNVGGTTGINEVVNQSTKLNDGKYYTLSGQQVEKPTAGGIYIHNGRKFVVK